MKSKDIKNYGYNLIYQFIQIASSLLVIPYTSRILGAASVGSYSYTQSNITILILLCTMGTSLYSQRELAAFSDNREKSLSFISEILLLRMITTVVGSGIFLFLLFNSYGGIYRHLYFLQLLDILSAVLDISWIYQAFGRFKQLAIRNIAVKFLYMAGVFLLVRSPGDLDKYILCYSVTGILGNVLLWMNLNGFTSDIRVKSLRPVRPLQLFRRLHPFRHLRPILSLFLPQAATQVYTVLDKSMIGYMTESPKENGYYEQATKIVRTLLMAVTSLGTVMLTQNAKLAADQCETLGNEVVETLKFILWIAIPISFGSIGIAPMLLPLFLGTEFVNSVPIMQILSMTIILIAVSNVTGVQYLLAVRRHKDFSGSVIFGAVVNLALNLILIPKLGAVGAAIASVAAEICVSLAQIVMIRKTIEFSMKALMNIIKCFLAAGGMLFIILVESRYLQIGWLGLLVQIISGVIVYYSVLYLLKEDNTRKLFAFGKRG